MDRRSFILAAGAALGAGAAARPAAALSAEAARVHVREAVDAVLAIVRSDGGTAEKAERLRGLFDEFAAMPQIARFAAGPVWRDMSGAQQEAYTRAFAHYLSVVYARRFQEYSGETVDIEGVSDAGRRGMLVRSRVTQSGGDPVAVEWLISDRPGRTVIADIIIEGVSLLVTQREEMGAILESRGGDIDGLIEALRGA